MIGKIFLVHWNEFESAVYADQLRISGWEVEVGIEDGARACKRIKQDPPDVVVIYLNRLPSHGRETGSALSTQKTTRDIPLVFVDGDVKDVEKTKTKVPAAIYASSSTLNQVLSQWKGLMEVK